MNKILIIEDDSRLQRALTRIFESEGYQTEVAEDGQRGMAAFRLKQPAAVVLDLKLPGLSGKEVCREIKKASPALPVVVLSAKSHMSDKVLLLELGADDYITKPFSPRELLARVQASIRRYNRAESQDSAKMLTFGSVKVDVFKMEIVREGLAVGMTAQEFKILTFFLQNPERVVTREELLSALRGEHNSSSTRTIDIHISKLRQKVEDDPGKPHHFTTIHGMGYKFVP